jgi:predicted DNA-binding transcriptional regulator YafY
MERTVNAQMRILNIVDLLSNESSQDEPMRSSNILRRLEKQGLYTTRATLKRDIELLRKYGFEIECITLPSGEHYYIKKHENVLQKPSEGSGMPDSIITRAVRNQSRLSVTVHDAGEISVSPYAVLRDDRDYYIACFSPAHRRILLLPFSKIKTAQLISESVDPPPSDYNLAYYTAHGFEICLNASETVTLKFEKGMLDGVLNRFEDSVLISSDATGFLLADVITEISPELFTWLFRLGGRVRITSPEYVCNEYKNYLRSQLTEY